MAVAAWIILSTLGLVFAGVDALSSYDRWRLATVATPKRDRTEREEQLVDFAKSTMMSQLGNLALFAILLVIGLTAQALDWLFPWLMFSMNIILVAKTVQEYRFRRRMYGD